MENGLENMLLKTYINSSLNRYLKCNNLVLESVFNGGNEL